MENIMDKRILWKFAVAAAAIACITFVGVAFYLIPRLYNLSAEADFTYNRRFRVSDDRICPVG